MEASHTVVGIDVSKDTCTATWVYADLRDHHPVYSFSNTVDGCLTLIRWLFQHAIEAAHTTICIENTGGYSLLLAQTLYAQGWIVTQVGPYEVYQSRLVAQTKTDAYDCRVIAAYAVRYPDRLRPFIPRVASIAAIDILLQQREQFLTTKRALCNQRHAMLLIPQLPPETLEPLEAMITECREAIKECDRRMAEVIRNDKRLRDFAHLLSTIPGVGPVLTAAMIVALDAGERRIEARSLAAWIGIAPLERQSGTMNKPARSRGYGPRLLRRLLYLCATGQIREGQSFNAYFVRKVREGKSKRLLINNVENKLLRVICAVVRDQQPYYPTYRSAPPMAA